MTFRYATVKIILAEVFVRPGAGYLWSNDFARNRIEHSNILGGFHIVLGIILGIQEKIAFLKNLRGRIQKFLCALNPH